MNNAVGHTVMPLPVPATEGGALLAIIERAARDPSIDLDKLERLINMRDAAAARAAQQEFTIAMTDAQSGMGRVSADCSNPQTRSKYASYAALDRELRPIYTQHGFSLSFDTADGAPPDCVRVVCDVGHRGGHIRRYHIDMPADGKGARGNDVMTKTHATGSAVTYGRRYLLLMIFNIAVGQDLDDDGNGASTKRINPHVTRAEDLHDHIPDAVDSIPDGHPDIMPLRKTEQRQAYTKLREEMQATQSRVELRAWGKENADRCQELDPEWRKSLRALYAMHERQLDAAAEYIERQGERHGSMKDQLEQ